MAKHWTEKEGSFQHFIAMDFLIAIEAELDRQKISMEEFGKMLGVSEEAVCDIFKYPHRLTLSRMVKLSRILGLKTSVVVYNDGDPENERGPINADLFKMGWELLGRPNDFLNFEEIRKNYKNKNKK